MTPVVIDASTSLGWLRTSQASKVSDALIQSVDVFVAPAIFAAEARNAALKLERRQLVRQADTTAWLAMLAHRIQFAPPVEGLEANEPILDLARRQQLGFFDAHYLHLAIQQQCELASRDGALLDAAARLGVRTIDAR